jgi:broad specificity phosphatase PhoE
MMTRYSADDQAVFRYLPLIRFRGSMTITIDPKLEARLREKAEAEGLTVSAYVERLVNADQTAEEELEALALEGLNSGPAIEEVGPGFWEELHKDLDERLKRTGTH